VVLKSKVTPADISAMVTLDVVGSKAVENSRSTHSDAKTGCMALSQNRFGKQDWELQNA
jgi:hypothetical protein